MTADTLQLDPAGTNWRKAARARARLWGATVRVGYRRRAAAAKTWTITKMAPGLTGICLVCVAAGGIVAEAAGTGLGVFTGLGLAGLFLLRIDSRMG